MTVVVSWTEWHASVAPAVVSALLKQRTAALLYAENHFNALSRQSNRHRHLSSLASRFKHPRFRVHAWSGQVSGERVCLVGWRPRAGDSEALNQLPLTLRIRDGAEVLAEGDTHLLRLPASTFLGAVWH